MEGEIRRGFGRSGGQCPQGGAPPPQLVARAGRDDDDQRQQQQMHHQQPRKLVTRRQKLLRLREARRKRRDAERNALEPGQERDGEAKRDLCRDAILVQQGKLPHIDHKPLPVVAEINLREAIGTVPRLSIVPRLDLKPCRKVGDNDEKDKSDQEKRNVVGRAKAREQFLPLHEYEKRRNVYLVQEKAIRATRQSKGREERARMEAAAIKVQCAFRGVNAKNKMSQVVELLQRRMKEEEEERLRILDEQRRAKIAAQWLDRVDLLPASPLKQVLKKVDSFSSTFELELTLWGVKATGNDRARHLESIRLAKTNILEALSVFYGARVLHFFNCAIPTDEGKRKKRDAKAKPSHDQHVEKLAASLQHFAQMESLVLENCQLNSFHLEKILASVHYGCRKHLRHLSIRGNYLSRGVWEAMDNALRPVYEQRSEAADIVANIVRNLPQLASLDLSRNFFGGKPFRAIVAGFAEPKPILLRLNLAHCEIGFKDAYFLDHVICASVALKSLDISGNPLCGLGFGVLETALVCHKSLEELAASRIQMGDRGALIVSRIIKANCFLRSIDVANNLISGIGLNEITSAASSLRGSTSLAELDLSFNTMPSDQIGATRCLEGFSRMLERCPSLLVLRLQGVNMFQPSKQVPKSKTGVFANLETLLEGLKINNTLRLLDLRKNRITARINKPLYALRIVRDAKSHRKGLYIPRPMQEVVAKIFARYFDQRIMDRERYSYHVIMRVLAFLADTRTVLI